MQRRGAPSSSARARRLLDLAHKENQQKRAFGEEIFPVAESPCPSLQDEDEEDAYKAFSLVIGTSTPSNVRMRPALRDVNGNILQPSVASACQVSPVKSPPKKIPKEAPGKKEKYSALSLISIYESDNSQDEWGATGNRSTIDTNDLKSARCALKSRRSLLCMFNDGNSSKQGNCVGEQRTSLGSELEDSTSNSSTSDTSYQVVDSSCLEQYVETSSRTNPKPGTLSKVDNQIQDTLICNTPVVNETTQTNSPSVPSTCPVMSPSERSNQGEHSSNSSGITITFTEPVSEELCASVCASIDVSRGEDILVLPLSPAAPAEEDHELEESEEETQALPQRRTRKPHTWKRKQVKLLSDSGQAHTSLRGKQKEARAIRDGCDMKCRRNCHQKFTDAQRQTIFQQYWGLQNHTMQWMWISKFVKAGNVKTRTAFVLYNQQPRRNFSNHYFFPNAEGLEEEVCMKFFLGSLDISQSVVRTATQKHMKNKGAIPVDKRGKVKKVRELTTAIKTSVINHINKFPRIEGHYTRKDSKAMYLAENLNRRRMHSIYSMEQKSERTLITSTLKQAVSEAEKTVAELAEKGETEELVKEAQLKVAKAKKELDHFEKNISKLVPIATLRQYRDIFKSDFYLKFYRSKKDQCAKCLSWANKLPSERTEEAERKYKKHVSDKKHGSDLKIEDIDYIKDNPDQQKSICVMTCDLEKVLLCPKGENSEFYYKSKLSIHNFTIFVSGDQEAFCYVWDQTVGSKGAAEITSCLWKFFEMKIAKGIKEFRIYSDNCSAQNKNQYLFSMYVMASIRFQIRIVHRYLEVGHTHMEVDSVHACIENSVKKTTIYTPQQWFAAIKKAKTKRPFYNVIEMTQDEILDFVPLSRHQTWSKLKTSQFKEVIIDSNNPGLVLYKTEYEEDSIEAAVAKKSAGRPVNYKTFPLKKRYSARIPLRKRELDDLQALCKSGAIPTPYAHFYLESIPSLFPEDPVEPPSPLLFSESESEDDLESDDKESEDEEDNDE